ncbi:MAG: WYL domain-containing protein [Bacteroidales bacterium]|nr:WYL domain-containing protein [Bacteroidales bacterium]
MLHAIKNRIQATFSYQKYYTGHPEEQTVNPLALKEFKYRWYLLARDIYDNRVKIYVLSHGESVKVMEAQSFAEEMKESYREALEKY